MGSSVLAVWIAWVCSTAAVAATDNRFTVAALPLEVKRIEPVKVTEKEPGHLVFDFGQDSFGGLEIEVVDTIPGKKISMSLGEALSGDGLVARKPGGSVRFLASEVTLEAGKKIYSVPLAPNDKRRMPQNIGPVMPFRYVEVEGAPLGFGRESIRQLAVYYPFDDNAAHFESSDPKLNAIWKLCKHTMKATSFCGFFVDGDRERKPYEADAYINQLGWWACTSDTTLPCRTWEYLVLHPTWPTEWILFTVLLAWDDYLYTGDASGLKEFYSELQSKTLLALARPDGLIGTIAPPMPKEVGQAIHIDKILDIVDWPVGERDHYEMKPINTVVNAFHVVALQRMAKIARTLEHSEDAARFEAAAAQALRSLNEKLFDPATGLYIDGEGSQHSSIHANFFPLAFGLVPPERREKVATFLDGQGMACSVYAAQFLLESLFDNGHADRAVALMTADGDRSWTHMVEQGTTMTWEAWDPKYKPNQDWNHAWGAAPANLIPRKVMGIEPLEPGFAKVLIQPRSGSLKWAEMRVPTVRGSLFVRFENETGYRLEVELPPNTSARIGIPFSGADGPAMVSLDGNPAAGMATQGTVFIEGIGPGKHTLTRP